MHRFVPLFALTATALAAPLARSHPQAITTEPVATVADTPVYLTAPAADERLFVVELEGRVRVIADDALLPTPFLDIAHLVDASLFTGLRATAFHPRYVSNGFFFVSYNAPDAGGRALVVARYTVSADDPNRADATSGVEVLRVPGEEGNAGAQMHFGLDGLLYIALGDGYGDGGDPDCNSQNGSSLWGKMLRLDVDRTPYAIPADNPFVDDPRVLDEIWHIGFRHPWRWSFDRLTGHAFVADVGEDEREEIDFLPLGVGGLNFGWKVMEGTTCHSGAGCPASAPPCGSGAYAAPIYEYDNAGPNCAVTGGFVYRGSRIPSLYGEYMFAEFCSGRITTLRYDGSNLTDLRDRTDEIGGAITSITSFGEDGAGELYIVRRDGQILRIVPRDEQTYCTAKVNSCGSSPGIGATGTPSATSSSGFDVTAVRTRALQAGLLIYTDAGRGNAPFDGGILCLETPPLKRTIAVADTAGTPGQCNGALSIDMNAFAAGALGGHPLPSLLVPGTQINCQFWGRDSPGNSLLSDALEYFVGS